MVVELPIDQFPTEGFLPATVESATYYNRLYGYPTSSDGGLLYYRKDLLDRAGLKPPTTWAEMKAACRTIQAASKNKDLDCYAGQYQKYEGLTVNFAEAVNSAGGSITDDDGVPVVDSPQAERGLSFLVNSFKDGTIPRAAITWQEEHGRRAFQDGNLIFHRNWPYVYALASQKDGSSSVAGKFAVAPLPGLNGPGVSSLGGHNMAIATYAENKGTAADFIRFMASKEVMKSNVLATSAAPTLTSLYTDPAIVEKYPYMPILLESIETAEPRPKVVRYGDVTRAIQDNVYSALLRQRTPEAALSNLQTELQQLIQTTG
jgi:multiple sugar transport system substrate-binding protein